MSMEPFQAPTCCAPALPPYAPSRSPSLPLAPPCSLSAPSEAAMLPFLNENGNP